MTETETVSNSTSTDKAATTITTEEGIAILSAILAVFIGNAAHHPVHFWFPISWIFAVLACIFCRYSLDPDSIMTSAWMTCLIVASTCYTAIAITWFARCWASGKDHAEPCRGPVFKKGVFSADFRSFDEVRNEEFYAYVRALVNRKPDPNSASYKLQRDTLKLSERRELELEVEKNTRREFGFFAQFTLCARDEQCFHYPIRIIASFLASTYAIGIMAVIFQQTAVNTVTNLQTGLIWAKQTQVLMATVATAYNTTTGDNLYSDSYRFRSVLAYLDDAMPHIESLMYAIKDSATVANLCGCIMYLLCWMTVFADFRSKALMMRRGIYTFDAARLNVKFRHAFAFFGTSVSNTLVSFFIIYFVIGFIFLILLWSVTQAAIGYVLYTYRTSLAVFVFSYVGNYLVTYLAAFYIGYSRVIRRRYAWMAYDFFQLFSQSVAGMTTAIIRALLALCAFLISIPRHDRSADPEWVDNIYMFDSLAKAYYASLLLYHNHNNPVVNVFASLLASEAKARVAGAEGYLPYSPDQSRKLWARNRWRKAMVMLMNPAIRKDSARGEILEPSEKKKGNSIFGKKVMPMKKVAPEDEGSTPREKTDSSQGKHSKLGEGEELKIDSVSGEDSPLRKDD